MTPTPETPSRQERREAARAERKAAEQAELDRAQRKRRLGLLGAVLAIATVVVVAVVLVAGGGSSGTSQPKRQAGEAVAGQRQIAAELRGIPQKGIALGAAKAPVTVVEFGDLQCPVCKAFSNDQLPGILDRYVRPGKVRMEFRTLSFLGPDSVRAGQMAQAAARQNKLYDFTELFYANQGQENSGYATDAFLRQIGGAVPGLDVSKAMAARPSTQQELTDADRLATINGVTGTPSFLVGPTGGATKLVDASKLEAALQQLTAKPGTAQ